MQVHAFCRCFVNSLQYVEHKTTWPMCRTSTHWLSSYKVVMSRHECELLYFTTASPTYIVGEAIYNGAGKPWNNTAQIHLQKIFRQGGSSGENWGNKDHKHISASFARLYTRMQGEGWVDAWIKYSFPYVLNCWHVSSLYRLWCPLGDWWLMEIVISTLHAQSRGTLHWFTAWKELDRTSLK